MGKNVTTSLGNKTKFRQLIDNFGLPRVIITGFLLLLFISAPIVGADLATQITNTINRFSWNAVLVLAMVPMIHSGCGLNFGLPLGIVSGLLFFTWRDEKAIHQVTQKYIDELQIKCTSSLQKARELSGGNQQKICLAKAFALEPRFLFVSEPTRGIDVGAKALVLEALKKFNRESGITVVMISSELEELRQVCDRIAIVSGGKIAGILPADHSSEEFGMLMVSQVK